MSVKYQLETIPVWDAFNAGGECPMCSIAHDLEDGYVEAALGASVMEPDTRVMVNEQGFCERHFTKLLAIKNRLGLALITHTHMREVMEKLSRQFAMIEGDLTRAENQNALSRTAGSATKLARYFEPFKESAAIAHKHGGSCFICGQIDHSMERYAETVCHLFATDDAFAEVFAASMGFCLPHYALLADAAMGMQVTKRPAFIRALTTVTRENLKRVEGELEWFTLKFDYRNTDKPWGNSKDAPERAINMLVGRIAGEARVSNGEHGTAAALSEGAAVYAKDEGIESCAPILPAADAEGAPEDERP